MRHAAWKQGRSDGGWGVYRDIYPPKSVYLKFLCGCFVSSQWLVNIYTHPNQIPWLRLCQEAAYYVACLLDYNVDLLVEEVVLVKDGGGCVKS